MKNRIKGFLWLLSPVIFFVFLLVIVVLFFPVNGVLGYYDMGISIDFFNGFINIAGYVNLVVLVVGVGVGIYYLRKKDGITLPHITKRYAGFWRRLGAYVIDSVIFSVVTTIIGNIVISIMVAVSAGNPEPNLGLGAIVVLIMTIVSYLLFGLYYVLFESSKIQATPGKMALGLKVTDLHGKRLSFGRASARYFAKIVSVLAVYVGFMMIGWTEKKQGLHDMIVGSLVVKE